MAGEGCVKKATESAAVLEVEPSSCCSLRTLGEATAAALGRNELPDNHRHTELYKVGRRKHEQEKREEEKEQADMKEQWQQQYAYKQRRTRSPSRPLASLNE